MYVDVDWDKVIDIESGLDDGVYTISIVFDNCQAMTYGYTSKKEFMKDYTYIIQESNK